MMTSWVRRWFGRWSAFDSATSLAGYIFQGLFWLTGLTVAGVVAAAASTWDWFWSTFKWAGIAAVFLAAWLIVSLGFFLIAHAVAALRASSGSTPDTALQERPSLSGPEPVSDAASPASANSQSEPSKPGRQHELKQKLLGITTETFLFLDPPKREAWKARTTLTRNGKSLRICLDYSAYSGGVGSGFWSRRQRVVLRAIDSFVKGQDLIVDVLYLDSQQPRFWRWATLESEEKDRPLIAESMFQCRLVFIAEGEQDEYFYFIVLDREGTIEPTPTLIGEHLFSFKDVWEGSDRSRWP